MDIIEPTIGGGLTGYGAYRARRALRKIQSNRAQGRDWRGRPSSRYSRLPTSDTEMDERERPPTRSGRTRIRRLSAREMDERETRPLRTTTFDEEDETDEFRQARPQEARTQPRGRSLRERFRRPSARSFADESNRRGLRTTSLDESAETEMGEIQYTNVEEDEEEVDYKGAEDLDVGDEFPGGEGEMTEMRTIRQSRPSARSFADESNRRGLRTTSLDESADDFRPVSLEDAPDNPAVQSQWQRSFRSRLQRLIRKPPAADPEVSTELQTAQEAESSAAEASTEADTTLQDIDEAFQQSRASLARQQNELRQTRSQLQEVPEEDRPADMPDTTFNEAELDAEAEADVAGEQAEGLENAGDEVEDLDEEEEDLGDDAPDDAAGEADASNITSELGTAAEGGGEATGLEESAGAAEAIGGGPEDPIGDVVAGGLAIAGGVVALGQWFGGLFHNNPEWFGVQNATELTGSSYQSMITNIQNEIQNKQDDRNSLIYSKFGNKKNVVKGANGQPLTMKDIDTQIKALQQYQQTLQNAQSSGRAIVSYTNSKGKKAVALQLSKKELANAIQAYQVNPDVYKGWDKSKLSIMGLNPNMSLGKAGATKTPEGTYVPTQAFDYGVGGDYGKKEATWTSGAGGGNWSNFYLSRPYQQTLEKTKGGGNVVTFGSNRDIQQSGNTPAEKKQIADGIYMTKLQDQIAIYKIGSAWNGYNDGTWNWLKYKLALFKYNNGLSSVKPTPVPPPITKAGKEEIAKLQANENTLNTSIANINAQIAKQQSQIATDTANQTSSRRNLQQAKTALTNAQQAEQQAMTAAKSYDTNLAQQLTSAYSQQYQHDLESAIKDNTAFNPAGLINPAKIYQQNYVKGTGVVAPKSTPVPTGITFVNGVPQMSGAFASNPVNNVPSGTNQPTTGVAPSTKTIPAQQSVAVNPSKPAIPAKSAPITTGSVSNRVAPPSLSRAPQPLQSRQSVVP
jgi:hypothetical protein